MSWDELYLGDLIHVRHGFAFKSEYFSFCGKEIVLTPGNFYELGGFKSRGDKDRYYLGDYPKQYLLKKGDLIVAMTEQGEGLLGSAALIPDDDSYLHNQRLGLVEIIDTQRVDKYFLYLVFNNPVIRAQISGSATGTKVKHTAPERIYKCKYQFPPVREQQKIAAILSAYDDLIENNLQRIKLMEEMAQITYEEWFVRLKFPGHENAKIDSETGLLEGWTKRTLKEVTAYINRGVSPKYVEADGFPVINQKCIRAHSVNFSESRLTSSDHKVVIDKLLKPLDILVNSTGTGTLGRVAQLFYCPEKATVDTHVTIVRPATSISPYLLGRQLESIEPFIVSLGKGATNQQELGRSELAEIVKIIVPTRDLMNKYDSISKPIYSVIPNLQKQNASLKEARDILLPRLMTGMIDVDNIELPEVLLARMQAGGSAPGIVREGVTDGA